MNKKIIDLYNSMGISVNLIEGDRVRLFNSKNEYYQEDYILIKKFPTGIFVYEVHRDFEKIKASADSMDEALIYAIFAYKKLYDRLSDNNVVRNIRQSINSGNENTVLEYIKSNYNKDYYSIDEEVPTKISLIRYGSYADIKFMGKYIEKNVSISRGYVILYNYYIKLNHICLICNMIEDLLGNIFSSRKALTIYLL